MRPSEEWRIAEAEHANPPRWAEVDAYTLHSLVLIASTGPDSGEPGPEDPVTRSKTGTAIRSPQDLKLMSESQILDLEGCAGSNEPTQDIERTPEPRHGSKVPW